MLLRLWYLIGNLGIVVITVDIYLLSTNMDDLQCKYTIKLCWYAFGCQHLIEEEV